MERFIDVLFQPFTEFWKGFAALVPNLMAMLLILLAGILSARLFYLLVLRVLRPSTLIPGVIKQGLPLS
ncbi:MAG: hypothetical protein AAB014_03485 [Nitrospirota bacterium]